MMLSSLNFKIFLTSNGSFLEKDARTRMSHSHLKNEGVRREDHVKRFLPKQEYTSTHIQVNKKL
jgi:hypothetical protein